MTKYESITTLEQAKTELAKLEKKKTEKETELAGVKGELAQKNEDWDKLSTTFEEEVKRQVAEQLAKSQPTDTSNLQDQITNLQTEKQTLEGKIKALENKEEQSSTWEKVKTPVIIGGGLLLLFIGYKLISSKFSGK